MPTYQYACRTCDHRFDAVQSFADEALLQCPECGGVLRKVFSAVGVVFKGSGFYRNDSRSKASANGGDRDSSPGSAGDPKSDSAGAKPEKSDGKTPAAAAPGGSPASGNGSSNGKGSPTDTSSTTPKADPKSA